MNMMDSMSNQKIIVVCLEGCHGCGKTSLCEEFEARGYRVLDEAFMDVPSYALHPQTLLMETSWVCSWFERVLRLASRVRLDKTMQNRPHVYIADRSPFSAVFYARTGRLLEPVIRAQQEEVEQAKNVQFYTVNINVEPELLWERIQARLEREPERVRFNEHKRSWMEQTLDFYNNFKWDFQVQNGVCSVSTVVDNITKELCERDGAFRDVHARKKSQFLCDSSFTSTDSDEEIAHEISSDDGCISPIAEDFGPSIISFNNFSMEDF
ncbi:hypothetical protein Poli38472_008058 [Pythium oligandrum]|uniref:NadR/Ttd14 AAA domain-containing protein n=1 Tax=Pythium oligandrum TaxID=41045 RepID=A0A8K1FJY2_PYTOL|nr:hypothetical protein Poli38472_008058 [Pythium oligandrum]|eukprot:TMW65416.1 hypothetical protein Poli38472_008058 [Pythium oligandrum]